MDTTTMSECERLEIAELERQDRIRLLREWLNERRLRVLAQADVKHLGEQLNHAVRGLADTKEQFFTAQRRVDAAEEELVIVRRDAETIAVACDEARRGLADMTRERDALSRKLALIERRLSRATFPKRKAARA